MDARGAPVTGDDRWTDPRWDYPEYPDGSVVEIRVHGVGGEPPSGMTRDPHPRLVGGDDLAGFWRARNPVVRPLTAAENGPLHVREVLSWGGHTSGTFRHAFWVLLLPFALLNFAGRMHPHDPDGAKAAKYRAVGRALGYTLTLTVTALLCGLAFDLLGAQCGSEPTCLLGPGGDETTGSGSAILAPLRYFDGVGRMGLLTLLPVLAVIALWWAGRYRIRQLEGREEMAATVDRGAARHEPTRISDPSFWRSDWPTSRLRTAHATGVFAFIGATLCLVLLDFAPREQQMWWWLAGVLPSIVVILASGIVATAATTIKPAPAPALQHTLWVLRLIALAPLSIATVLALYGHAAQTEGAGAPGRAADWLGLLAGVLPFAGALVGLAAVGWWVADSVKGARGERPDTRLVTNLALAGGLALMALWLASTGVVTLEDTAVTIGAVPESFAWVGDLLARPLGWLNRGVYVPAYALLIPLSVVYVALLVGLAILGWDTSVPQRADRGTLDTPAVAGNLGGVVVALLALLVMSASGASLHALALDWLGARVEVGAAAPPGETGLVLPWGYGYTAVVTTLVLPAVLLLVFVVRQTLAGRTVPKADEAAVADHLDRGFTSGPAADGELSEAHRRRLRVIAKRWRTEHLIRDAGAMLSWAIGITVALIIARFIWVAVDPSEARSLARELPFTTLAVWATTGIMISAVGLMRRAMREEGTRRDIGKLWDVVTFWPRVTHPFAPPCYAEAVVPLLNDRIHRLLAAPGNYKVLLAGHSQGSVVALTSALTADLPADGPRRLALAVYGSPIAILYERFFPGVFGTAAGPIELAESKVASWHHFFAMTEPFALPFWQVTDDSGPMPRDVTGWPAHLRVTHPDTPCPVCGWSAPAIGSGSGATRADIVVIDPDRWTQPLDSFAPEPLGHSSYHHHREVDEHLCHIASLL
ncbi:MAG TPA: hypothetical protein VML96_10505 [Egibacteraceae bacterium]|nr:hypothetical protein [Egibacteraceae bacterium]